ncbi:MAG: HDOD domain-containing protein, partial [Phycisphaerales bacterium]|nr:HDOD domain-containing protein [Phycisphaerales bacterium]
GHGTGPGGDSGGTVWQTAVACEQLALQIRDRSINPGEAFVCGILHDIGKIALDHVLPKSYGRVIELVELNQGNIAEFERRVIGIDHHTAGKRLAEQWGLSHLIQDCIWLHGCPFESLPKLDHRQMIGLVSLADLLVRKCHLGYSGNFVFTMEEQELAGQIKLSQEQVNQVMSELHLELDRRSKVLGLDDTPSQEMFMRSIQHANQMLGRLNGAMERRGRMAARQQQVLDAISNFHNTATPGRSVEDVMASVVASAHAVLGAGFYTMVFQGGPDDQWLVYQYNSEGGPTRSQLIDPPATCSDLTRIDASQPSALNPMGIMPILSDYLVDAPDLREVRVLPLGCGWGTAALLLHDRPQVPSWPQMFALASTWGSAIAAAGQHDGARRLGEELAGANRALAEAQDRLLQTESLARVGEMAAGAAHEMNNPLAVISGRAQILEQKLAAGSKEQLAAHTIVEQAHRLSDLISMLRLYADPPKAKRQPVNLLPVLDHALKAALARHDVPKSATTGVQANLRVEPATLKAMLDAQQIQEALVEIILNAYQSSPKTSVTLAARLVDDGRQLLLEVSDDGTGMDAHTLAHAMDPFFSNRPAGRRIGMGLPRAQLLIAAHGGRIELRSVQGNPAPSAFCCHWIQGHEQPIAGSGVRWNC